MVLCTRGISPEEVVRRGFLIALGDPEFLPRSFLRQALPRDPQHQFRENAANQKDAVAELLWRDIEHDPVLTINPSFFYNPLRCKAILRSDYKADQNEPHFSRELMDLWPNGSRHLKALFTNRDNRTSIEVSFGHWDSIEKKPYLCLCTVRCSVDYTRSEFHDHVKTALSRQRRRKGYLSGMSITSQLSRLFSIGAL